MLYIALWIYGTLFMPYIIGVILSIIIICLIRKKLINQNKKNRILIYIIIFIVVIILSKNLGYSAMLYLSERPDKLYTEMEEINDSKSLIGLSKEQVISLLGKPLQKSTEELYVYSAGTITNYIFLGEKESYELFIRFDENGKVKSTLIDFPRGG